jgi:hypothetical protein
MLTNRRAEFIGKFKVMSALTVLDKQLAALEGVVSEVELAVAGGSTLDLKSAKSLLEKVEKGTNELNVNIVGNVQKLVGKLDQKDPVTGNARYGDAARSRIVGFGDRCEKLSESFSGQHETLLSLVASVAQTEPATTADLTTVFTVRLAAPVAGPIRSIDRIVEFKKAETEASAGVSTEEDPVLAEKARLVRERKAQDAEEYSIAAAELETLLQSSTAYLNEIRNTYAQQSVQKGSAATALMSPVESFLEANKEVIHRRLLL